MRRVVPLTRISSRAATPLSAFTYRELIGQRRLAERALRRGRNAPSSAALIATIDAELDTRRMAKWDRAGRAVAP